MENDKLARSKQHKESLVAGFIKENPLFVSLLGMCPALATTTSVEKALGMGVMFAIVLICSNVFVSLLRKLIPDEIRTPSYIVIIAAFVTLVKMICHAYIPGLYSSLGVFLSLIVVNCVVLGRAESFASKNGPFDSFLDGIGTGLGFTLAIVIIAAIREVSATGTISIGVLFDFLPHCSLPLLKFVWLDTVMWDVSATYRISLIGDPAGGFIVMGLVLAILAAIKNRKATKQKVLDRLAKQKAKEAAAAGGAK